ncbi:MAG: peptidylprolyl isomerase [Bacteroidales bacterium]|nr:peptidylprolyl isomerase [Bacteroidales bacterium]
MKKFFLPLLLMIATMLATGCGQTPKSSPNEVTPEQTKKATVNCDGLYQFKINTKFGTMTGILYNETPIHRDNFLKLVGEEYYDGLLFHRVIDGFMIQGGDPASKGATAGVSLGNGGPGYTLRAEIRPEFIHKRGALAAARTGDFVNPQRESSGSQFYIVHGSPVTQDALDNFVSRGKPYTETQMAIYKKLGGTPNLDFEYTVFGEIIDGFDVIDAIATVQKDGQDRPLENIVMKVELIK